MSSQDPKKAAILSHISDMFFIASIHNNSLSAHAQEFITNAARAYHLTDRELQQCFHNMGNSSSAVPHSEDDRLLYIKQLLVTALMDGSIYPEQQAYAADVCRLYSFNNPEDMVVRMARQIIREFHNDSSGIADDDTISEEEYQKNLSLRIREGKVCLERYQIPSAFDYLVYPALADATARKLFSRIIYNVYPLFMLRPEQTRQLQTLAEQGHGIAQYAYGRYHQLVRPCDNSLELAAKWLKTAMDHGIADAKCSYALMIRDGLLGMADHDEFIRLRNEAYKEESIHAFCNLTNEIIRGTTNTPADPEGMIDILEDILLNEQGQECTNSLLVEPIYYNLLGKAYQATGQNKKAEHAFINAIHMGHYESMRNLILLTCYDSEYKPVNIMTLKEYTRIGCEHNDAACYSYRADIPGRSTAQIRQDLETAYRLGDDDAPYILGSYCYYGEKGFSTDYKQAWKWFSLGAQYNSSACYAMLATMIDEKHCPNPKATHAFAAYCRLNALRLGDLDQLEAVIEAYDRGMLSAYRKEIEKYHLPLYQDMLREQQDEDDGRYDAWI